MKVVMKKKKEEFIKLLRKNKVRKKVIEAYEQINQLDFFDEAFSKKLYTDQPVPIGSGHVSDPPLALARMLHYLDLKNTSRVLEIGTGSAYSTALLSFMAKDVFSIEYLENLAREARLKMNNVDISNVRLFAGDGFYLEDALGRFDAIIICAACQKRPIPLMAHLKPGGKMVFPMGPAYRQQIAVMSNTVDENNGTAYPTKFHEFCEFPLAIGPFGLDINRFNMDD